MNRFPKPILVLLFFAYLLVIYRALFIGESNARSFLRGDAFTEYLSYNGIRYFFDHGFRPTYGLANYGYKGAVAERKQKEVDRGQVYLHYPPMTDNFTALTALAFGTVDIRILRIVPILFSFLWLWVMLRVLHLWHKDAMELWLSFGVLFMSNYFIAWADNTNKFMYEELIKWTVLLIVLRRFKFGEKSTDLPFLFLLFFIMAGVSYDGMVVSAFLVTALTITYRKRLLTLETVVPAMGALSGLALHFFQVYLFLGSWDAFMADTRAILKSRALGQGPSEIPPVTLWSYMQHLFYWNINRIERFFLIPGWALLLFAVILYRKWREDQDERAKLIWVLLVCSIAWNLVMWQHAMVHVWTARNWGLFVGLISGPGLVWLYGKLRNQTVLPRWQIALLWLVVIYIGGMALTQQVWDLYLRYGFLFPLLGG